MAAVAAPSTPSSSSSSSTFGKLFSKLRTPTTPSERDSNSHKHFATPTGAGAGSKSSSLRQQALTASASSTSLASQASASASVLESPNSSTWDIEMPKFETGDWLNAAGQLSTSSNSPYGQLARASTSTSTFASSVVSLASSIAVSEHQTDATLQQMAPSSSTLSFKALGMGSLSRARGKDVEPTSSGGSAGSSAAVDSSGDRLRKASFLSRSSTDNTAQPPPNGFSRSWTQKGKDLLNRSGGPLSHPHDAESSNSLVPDDFKSPAGSHGYSSLGSRTSSDSITPAARISALRRPLPTSVAASGRPRRAQRVPLSEVVRNDECEAEAESEGAGGESQSSSQPSPEANPSPPTRLSPRPPSSPGVHGRSRSEVPPASPKLAPHATDRSAATLTFHSTASSTSTSSYVRKPLRARTTDESEGSSAADVSPPMDGSRTQRPATATLAASRAALTSAALRQRMLHSNPSPPAPLPTSSTTPGANASTGFHRPASSMEIRGREQMLATEKPAPRGSLDERRRAGGDGDMMQPYASQPDADENGRSLQRQASTTLMGLGRRTSVSLQARAALRRTDSGTDSRPGSSTAMYADPPPTRSAPLVQDENDYVDPAAIRRPGSAMSMSAQPVPFPRQPAHHQERPVLGETYRATNAAPLQPQRQPRERVLAPKSSQPDVEYLAPVRDRSPGVGDVTPSLTHKQAYVGTSYQQQQQQQQQQQPVQMPPQAPPPEGPLPPKPQKRPQVIVVNGKRYNRIGLLGKGGSSRVYRVMDEANNLLAIKRVEINRNDAETRTSFINEINLLEKLRGNQQIIRLIDSELNEDASKSKHCLLMVMEVGETDLANLLQEKATKPVSMHFIRYIWEQMLEAVQVIHDENIVHTDLKPANFVLVKGRLKLIDFGISKAIANDTTNIGRDQQIGTANYMPPEALMDSGMGQDGRRLMKLGRAADVWALGCILYQMVYRCTPYAHIRDIGQKIMAIQNPKFCIAYPPTSYPVDDRGEERKAEGVQIGADIIAGMKGCLVFDKAKRRTIPELLSGAFLCPAETSKDAIDENDLAVIVKRVAKMVANKRVPDEEADMLANKLMLELRQARQ